MENRTNLTGKVAIVTGGAQGLGRATVQRLVEAGASVIAADINLQEANRTAQEIMADHGGRVLALQMDVADQDQVRTMVQASMESFGRIDILINNAGVCPVVPWADVTLESWNRILAVNLTGMFLCTQAVVPHMRANGGGRIVYVSSPAAYVGSIVAHIAYGVSKAGIIAMMKSVAKSFASDGILANAIAPGPIDTPMGHSFGPEFWDATEGRTLLKRHAAATEVADAILFLVSSWSSYVTGQVLWVDGGYHLT